MNEILRQKSRVTPILAAVIIAATLIAYLPAMRAGYIWDDDDYVYENPTLRSVEGLRQIWFELGATSQYYPLVHTTYWLEYRFWGLNPYGYHIVNILLHITGALLLWRILRILNVPGAWFAAAIFALHPVHVESVAWITERKNVLSGVFYLCSIMAYLKYLRIDDIREHGNAKKYYIYALILFVCALLSKTVTCTLPAVLLLIIWWKRHRIKISDVLLQMPFFIIGISFAFMTVWIEKYIVRAIGKDWDMSFIERFLVACRVPCFYAGKLLWPNNLMFTYPRWQIDPGLWQQYLFVAAVLGAIALLWFLRRRIGSGPLVAVLFFVGTLTPALGFFNVYLMQFSYVADHFQYLASIGIIALAAALGCSIVSRIGTSAKIPAYILTFLILAMLTILSWRQCHIYKDEETLWRDTLVRNPDSWLAHLNLGVILQGQKKIDEATGHYREVLLLKPDHARAYCNIANMLLIRDQLDEAIEYYLKAVQFEPDYIKAHSNLAVALQKQKRSDEAIDHFNKAIELMGDNVSAPVYNNLANTYKFIGRIDKAVYYYQKALQIDPENPTIRKNLNATLSLQ